MYLALRDQLDTHYKFTEWSTVMFSVLCIYEIHHISQNPMFTMVTTFCFRFENPLSKEKISSALGDVRGNWVFKVPTGSLHND